MNDGALPERKCWRCGATDMFNLAFNGLCVRCDEVARAHVRFGIEKPAEAEHKSTPGGLRPQLPQKRYPTNPWPYAFSSGASSTAMPGPSSAQDWPCF